MLSCDESLDGGRVYIVSSLLSSLAANLAVVKRKSDKRFKYLKMKEYILVVCFVSDHKLLTQVYKTLLIDQNLYLRTSPSTSPISTKGSTLRSARLQTARAMCKEAEVFPPPGKIKFSKGGKCFVYSSIHSSNSAVCLVFKEGTLSI